MLLKQFKPPLEYKSNCHIKPNRLAQGPYKMREEMILPPRNKRLLIKGLHTFGSFPHARDERLPILATPIESATWYDVAHTSFGICNIARVSWNYMDVEVRYRLASISPKVHPQVTCASSMELFDLRYR